MAGTTHYYYKFHSKSGQLWKVEIKDTTYAGTDTAVLKPDAIGFNINWEGASEETYLPIVSSMFSAGIYKTVNSLNLLNSIIEGPECRFIVQVQKCTDEFYDTYDCMWRGWVMQDSMNSPDSYIYVDVIQIKATDGFGLLKDIYYTGFDVDSLDRYTVVGWIAKMMPHLPLFYLLDAEIIIETASVWYEDSMPHTSTDDPLVLTLIHESAYIQVDEYGIATALSFYDILVSLLTTFNLQISQWNGVYLIIQQNTYEQSSTRGWQYSKEGDYQGTELIDLNNAIPQRMKGGSFSYILPIKEITTEYEYKQTIFKNNLLPAILDVDVEYSMGYFDLGTLIIISGNIVTVVAVPMTLSNTISVDYQFTITNGSYYLKKVTTVMATFYEWTLTVSTFVLSSQEFTLENTESDGNYFFSVPVNILIPPLLVGDNTVTFEMSLNSVNYSNEVCVGTYDKSYLNAHILVSASQPNMEGTEKHRASVSNSARADLVLEKSIIGDGVYKYSAGSIFVNSSPEQSDLWCIYSEIGTANKWPVNSLRCEEMLALRRNTVQIMNGSISGEPNAHQGITYDGDNYCFTKISWDCSPEYYSFSAIKINPVRSGITVEEPLIKVDETQQPTSGGNPFQEPIPVTGGETHAQLHNLFSTSDHSGTGGTAKATIVDADSIVAIDSQDGSKVKRWTWAVLKAAAQTYLEPIWQLFTNQRMIDISVYGFMNQSETSISFSTYTFTLTSVGASWSYYRAGIKYTITGNKTKTLTGTPPTTGFYYIYIDDEIGTLTAGAAWTLQDTKVPVATVYYNDALTPKFQMADERHDCRTLRMDHFKHHFTDGTEYISGGAISGQTALSDSNTDKTFAISEAVISDDGLILTLAALADGNGSSNNYVIAYKSGGAWLWADSYMPFRYTAAGYIQYDLSGTMTQGANNKWYNTYLFLSNISGSARYLIIHGHGEFGSASAAYAENFATFNLSGLFVNEGVAIYQFTWHTSSSYSSLGKCEFVSKQSISSSYFQTNSVGSDSSWDLKVNTGGPYPIYKTGSTNTYKGLDLIPGTGISMSNASGADGFLETTIVNTGIITAEINSDGAAEVSGIKLVAGTNMELIGALSGVLGTLTVTFNSSGGLTQQQVEGLI